MVDRYRKLRNSNQTPPAEKEACVKDADSGEEKVVKPWWLRAARKLFFNLLRITVVFVLLYMFSSTNP